MRTRPCKWEVDGTGRAPAGTRKTRPVRVTVSLQCFKEALGWVYLHLRLRHGQSLRSVAENSGTGVETVCGMEHGVHAPRLDTEWLVAHSLGYEPDEVWRLTRRWLRRKMARRKRTKR